MASSGKTNDPLTTFTGHNNVVEDVAWHQHKETFFGSVGDDRMLMLWDTREKNLSKPTHSIQAHGAEINCVCFNPRNEFTLLTGGADKMVHLWDIRNLSKKLHEFNGHTGEVIQVRWA